MRFFKLTVKILAFLGVLYAFFIGVLYVRQDSLLFYPMERGDWAQKIQEKLPAFKEVSYSLPTGQQLYAWYKPAQKGKQTVLFFHGNGGCAESHIYHLKKLYQKGYGLLVPEYRGYGDIKGPVSQQTMEEDALTAAKYLKGLDISNKDIVIYGHSLGTYMAVYTAAQLGQEKPVNGVILESPFQSALSVAHGIFGNIVPVKSLLKNHFPSDNYIQKINTRLLVAHGHEDDTIPYEQGWALYQLAQEPKVFFSADKANHLDLVNHGLADAVVNWIEKKSVSGE